METLKGFRQGCLEGRGPFRPQENSHLPPHEGGDSREPIFQMIKPRKVEGCAQCHTACSGGARVGTRPDSRAADTLGMVVTA